MRNSFSLLPRAPDSSTSTLPRSRHSTGLFARDTFPLTDRSRLDIFPCGAPAFSFLRGGPTRRVSHLRLAPCWRNVRAFADADERIGGRPILPIPLYICNSESGSRGEKQVVASTSYFVSHYVNVWSTRFICFIFIRNVLWQDLKGKPGPAVSPVVLSSSLPPAAVTLAAFAQPL